MADHAPNDTAAGAPAAPCRHLRYNGMYIFDGQSDDDDEEASACWCLQTMKSYGPDDSLVGRRECRDSGRPCYEPL
jgi:hypothetical protein